MLDGIEGLFIVNESHVEWNVVLGGLFKYLSDRSRWSVVEKPLLYAACSGG